MLTEADPTGPTTSPGIPIATSVEMAASHTRAGRLSRATRTQIMVLSFYLADTIFMGAFATLGAIPASAAMAYGAAGCGSTGLFVVVVRMRLNRRLSGASFTAIQLLTACSLMVITAAAVPQIGVLMLMTLITAVATAALQLPLRYVLVISAAIAAFTLALLLTDSDRFGMPLDDVWLRLLSGFWFAVILAKIAAISLMGAEMRKALSASNSRLAVALTQLRELSERDELTGLQNRRSILALLTEERARFARGGLGFGVAILDIDHFKQVNDRFGHAMGDEVLRAFAKVAGGKLRSTDRLARYGGEEFLVLLPNTNEALSLSVAAERLRCAIDEHPWSDLARELVVTCSIGVTLSHAGESIAEIVERADAALYRAKAGGRNAVCAG
jgi:diguanylate cyclase